MSYDDIADCIAILEELNGEEMDIEDIVEIEELFGDDNE